MLVWPIPFVVIPFILKHVGTVGYGIWAVSLTITKLTAVADAGMGGAITKYVAEHHAAKETDALTRLVATSLAIYVSIAIAIVLALGALSGYAIPLLFRGSSAFGAQLRFAWDCTILIAAINLLIVPFYSIAVGLQRMDLSNTLGAFNSLAAAVFIFIFLPLGLGLRGLFYAYLISAFLTLALYIWSVRRLLPAVSFGPRHFERNEARKILSFSVQVYVTALAVTISTEIEKLYLSWFVGVVAVGWYDVASQVAGRVRRVPELLLTPLVAAASELDATGEHVRLKELYYRAHKYLALFAVPLFFYVLIAAHGVVKLWLGPKLYIVTVPIVILVAANLFNLSSGPGLLTLIGKGMLRPGVHSAVLGIALNLTLSFWLIYSYGFSGAVIGTAIAMVIATIFFLESFRRKMGSFSPKSPLKLYVKPLVVSASLSLTLGYLQPFRHSGWLGFLGDTLVFGSLYLIVLVFSAFFDAFDLDRIESLVPLAGRVRRFIPNA